ncbi:probable protein phosphatase 2C 51 [Solanum pennellii]|uniref:Probable protein phosphatase 2C 51 n=1 Tax=Solanum pennellii TaxID=28526 RepID=A0ABM1H0B7_SOLPN|nr:probable protein phosphatase 2C 51 [Solanum pennellii]
MKRLIIYGFFFACIVGFLMNNKPEPEEQIVVTNTTMSSISAQNCHFCIDPRKKIIPRGSRDVLVANVGDSKAFICSGKLAKELTEDHNADRLDERARVEASGGKFTFYTNYVPLLNGHFPMTRAIGDVTSKSVGIIATPEVTDWLNLTSKDEFLVVASDGIFESLSTKKVCEFLYEAEDHSDLTALSQQIVQKAFLEGSTENLSVVLVPL